MNPVARQAVRFVLLVGVYLAGARAALWFTSGPEQIPLIWPPSGIIFAVLLRYGLRWWPFIPVSVLLTHVWFAPVPALFLPWSLVSNLAGGLIGAAFVLRLHPLSVERYTPAGGFTLLAGGVLMVAVSSMLGALGMVHADMIAAEAGPVSALRWAMGDLFGVITVAPAALLAGRRLHPDTPRMGALGRVRRSERLAWALLLAGSIVAIAWAGQHSGAYALGLAGLPLALLLWSALRFAPLFTAAANLGLALLVATVAGLGLGGFTAPAGPLEGTVLVAFLCICALLPLALSAAAHEGRIATLRLLRRAGTDALTGLPNRVAFEDAVRAVQKRESGEPLALVYLDLDQFKLVNDILSHAVGDELIRALSGVLQARLGPHDLLARIGGDEFAVLLRHCPADQAEARVQRLRDAVAEYRFASDGHVAATTASAGIVAFTAGQADFAALLARADTACFAAKERGGNRSVAVPPAGGELVEERSSAMRWALRLNEALEHDRFVLFCQSISPLQRADPDTHHFEILLRLRDPESGDLLPPGRFMPAAERFGLGVRLDTYVLDRTLRWFAEHPETADRVELCSINLCAASVDDERFLDHLQKRLAHGSLPPQKLCFELTETSALRDLAQAQHFVQRLRALGCRFALDDFGTGFCSFGYLRSLDVDFFKIDGSFVSDVDRSPLSLAIVRSIADIGRVMQKETIAECVESDAIRRRLAELGVDYAQGYAVDHPMPIERYFDPARSRPRLIA